MIGAIDIDCDGDIDLVMDSHAVSNLPEGFSQEWKEANSLIILRNYSVKYRTNRQGGTPPCKACPHVKANSISKLKNLLAPYIRILRRQLLIL